MAFTKTYDPTVPINHTKFDAVPGHVRDTRVLFQERLAFGGMYFPTTHDELAGEHSYVRMANQGSTPAAVAGKWMLHVTASGLFIVSPAGTVIQITNTTGVISSLPSGAGLEYYGATLPSGFLWRDGSAVSRTTYADLFTAIGTVFGVGDGSTTFNLPDSRQRFSLGKAASGTGATLGATGGAIDATHDHGVGSYAFPHHMHNQYTVAGGAQSASPESPATIGTPGVGGEITRSTGGGSSYRSIYAKTDTDGGNAITGTAATSTAYNPPYIVCNQMIKT